MKSFIPSKVPAFAFGLIIGLFAIMHFLIFEGLEEFIPVYASGDSEMWIYITGIVHMFAAVCIITGWKKTEACYLLAAMLLIFAITIQLRGLIDAKDKRTETLFLMNMLKDSAMAACAILVGNRKERKKKTLKKPVRDE